MTTDCCVPSGEELGKGCCGVSKVPSDECDVNECGLWFALAAYDPTSREDPTNVGFDGCDAAFGSRRNLAKHRSSSHSQEVSSSGCRLSNTIYIFGFPS